jgi:hypothetical protein
VSTSADLWTVEAALKLLPSVCRYHGEDFGKLGYEGPHGQPRCESCRAPWRRMCGLAAVQRMRDAAPAVEHRITPDQKTWCESSSPREVVERSEGKGCRFERLTKWLVTNEWQPWTPECTP